MRLHGDGSACRNAETTEMTVFSTSGAVPPKSPHRWWSNVRSFRIANTWVRRLSVRSLGPVVLLGATWRSAHSPTALQAQTLVLRAGVDVLTVDESVAADDRSYAAGGVENSTDYVAVVKVDESVAADERDYAADSVANVVDYVAGVKRTGACDADSKWNAAAATTVQFPRD